MKIPRYRLHNSSGQALVEYKGVRTYLGQHGSPESKRAYQKFLEERVLPEQTAAPETAAEYTHRTTTVAELLLAYLEYSAEHYGKKNGEHYGTRSLCDPLLAVAGDCQVRDFGPILLKQFRQLVIDKGNARTYGNKQTNRVRRMFKWGVEHEIVPPDVLAKLQAVAPLREGKTKARESPAVVPVDETLVEAVLPFLSTVVADMVRLHRLTGMRPSELCVLRGCDIELTEDVWTYRMEKHKTTRHGKSRVVCFGPQAQEVLRPYLNRSPEAFLFSPKEALTQKFARLRAGRKTPVQPSQVSRKKKHPLRQPGDHYTTNSYRQAIIYGIRRASAAHWTPRQLRKTAATKIRKLFGLEAAQVTLGHARADVTQIYAQRDLDLARKTARATG